MHVLYVIQRYFPYRGGSELVCQVLAERMAAEGHQVSVWTSNAWDLDHFWASGRRTIDGDHEIHNAVTIRRFPVRRAPGPAIVYPIIRRLMVELSRFPGTSPLLRRMAQLTPRVPTLNQALNRSSERFSVIHTANITLDFMILPAWRFAREQRIPHVITPYVHLGEPGDSSLVRYYAMRHHIELLKQADRVIVQTGLEEDFLAQKGVPRQILRRIGVGVEPNDLLGGDAERFRATTGISAPFVLSIGTLARDKGSLDIITAMQQLWEQGHPADVVLVGTPMAHFEAAWDALPEQVRTRVHLLPRASDEMKRDALAAANVFALPSRTDSFGIVYLEAWLYGLPVIGARAGGVPDVIDDGVTGFVVPFGDSHALAERIAVLFSQPDLAQQLGAAGRTHTLQHLTWEHKFQHYRSVYLELCS